MRKAVIELYYDIVSPYSLVVMLVSGINFIFWMQYLGFLLVSNYGRYLNLENKMAIHPLKIKAFEVLQRYKSRWNVQIVLKPFFLGGVMKVTGNTPPLFTPRKNFVPTDISRLAQVSGISLKYPTNFPVNTLQHMRLLTAISNDFSHDILLKSTRKLWSLLWQEGKDITDKEEVRKALVGVLSPSEYEIAQQNANSLLVKEQLTSMTQEAIDRGAFGAPFMWVKSKHGREESFFGSDRFDHIAHFLNEPQIVWLGHDPVSQLKKINALQNSKL